MRLTNLLKSQTMNMTEGEPTSLLIKFAIPMMIGNIFQQLYNLVDSVVVGKIIGPQALAAIGATNSLTFFFFALCNGIGSGGGIITSQFFGGGKKSEVKSCIANVAYIMIAFPIVVGLISLLFGGNLLKLLDTPAEIYNDALIYLKINAIGLMFVSLYNYISSMLRALGDSISPLIFLIISCLLNGILDVLFVGPLHLGVFGAGIATLIAQLFSGALCIIFAVVKNEYFRLSKSDFTFNSMIVIRALKIGIPLSLQFSLIAISCMALQRVVNGFGVITVAAFSATSRIEQIIHQPYQTLSAALSTYTGQNYGANQHERMILGYKKSLKIMLIFTLIMVPVMQLFGNNIIMIFVQNVEKDRAVIEMGAKALRITSWFYVCLGMIYVVRGVLNGIGDSFFALLNGVVEVLGRIIVPVALVSVSFIDVWGIWWSVGIVWFLSGFTAWLRYVWIKKTL